MSAAEILTSHKAIGSKMALSIHFLDSHHNIIPTHVAAVCNVPTPLAVWSKAWISSLLIAEFANPTDGTSVGVVSSLCVVMVVVTATS
jgi:hypothetical protein